ncbi:SPOR domain-containing protein [Dickeya solani]|uniref:Cell division protein DamX n=1 Tax=Dickeya solani TaxID=1089444 RepID=A0ABU4EEB8_9GAMM|nr:SPOR domain-containing protein [Dickeya solani]MCA7000657.1 SPOR domain-containing protein [Dickeya solani]MCZ0823075.1 SPOR domain-containing protein [Dickeya solani]MDV6997338.1 SPOR domain-containing protein [Dickeya solani]MDV7003755.1 SPOR domain-containing protein [Dickeya solani]MDV7036511.1 SPOR domain-containing protein [Dickeya solani]
MDEFNPEEELKPDTSDRRPARQQRRSKGFSAPSVSLSRQHTMIGIGIVVLVLLIIGIGSALQSPGQNTSSAPSQPAGSGRNIDLSSSMSASQEPGTPPPAAPQPSSPAPVAAQNPNAGTGSPQTLSGQPVSGTPTQAPLPSQNNNQQRIELPGNITDALSQPQQQDRVNAFSSGLPTEPATVLAPATKGGRAQTVEKSPSHVQAEKQPSPASHKTVAEAKESAKPAANAHRAPTTAVTPAPASKPAAAIKPAASAGSQSGTAIQSAPAGHFTLQLSSASREESLKAYAREQRLANYWVYETKRDGRPWYVLVNGVYASPEDAKRAVASLPADVQAKKPWVRPIRQVKQDLTK